jgi:salicylate hydroxylase
MSDEQIIIAGAGMGGLCAALGLGQAGFEVCVLEAAPELSEVGAGLTLAANATSVLHHLGLRDTLDHWAVVPARGAVMHYRTGQTMVDIPRGPETYHRGAPYCQIHRADLQAGLVAALARQASVRLEVGKQLARFEQDENGVLVSCADGSQTRGRLLIGCDGIRSAVRAQLYGADEPRFTGYVAWRGLIPMTRLTGERIEPESAVWQGPGHFLTRYKVRAGQLLNFVGIARAEQWTDEGWSIPATVDELLAEFAEFNADARRLLAATPPDGLFKWGIFDREPLEAWTDSRVTLLGDAAHPMTPFLGQGAAMAIEDAAILTRAISAEGAAPAALTRYETARRERTTRVFLESRAQGERLTSYNPDQYTARVHRNEETLGLADYDAVSVAI